MKISDNNYDKYSDDEFEETMDKFFEKIASINTCYNNGHKLVTSKKTLADLTKDKLVVMFPFNPNKLEDFLNVADLMISYFELNEEYEKCSDLMKVKHNMIEKINN